MSAGLKDLSLKVMEQVIKHHDTTYSKVASQLIAILKNNSSMMNAFCDASDEEDTPLEQNSDNSPLKTDKMFDKREKNIRRRVYDALNV